MTASGPVAERGDDGDPARARVGSADVSARIAVEFATFLPAEVIAEVIRDCRRDLQGVSPEMMPELLERLARQCLIDRLPDGGSAHRSGSGADL
ncbi:hypothetical protein [Pseudonocardia sp. KRD291]|uniref:hypothetical protein n=1 Tax=Pseudonocardia sp. KRD291 TaxID=2792007 RepID=UPI001C4A34A2|nr:hypothetical protein [Pseudonocardia sp. KRD291]MBW0101295.1 hypothetical protein [Pseudonocardia sp. KRD291]